MNGESNTNGKSNTNFTQNLGRILGRLMHKEVPVIKLPPEMTIEQALRPAYTSREGFELSKEIARKALKERLPHFPVYDVDKDLQRTFRLSLRPRILMPMEGVRGGYNPTHNMVTIQEGLTPQQTRQALAHEAIHALFGDALWKRSRPTIPGYLEPITTKNPVPLWPDKAWKTYLGTRVELDPALAAFKRRLINDKVLNASSTYQDVLEAAKRYQNVPDLMAETFVPIILTRLPQKEREILAKRLLQLVWNRRGGGRSSLRPDEGNQA